MSNSHSEDNTLLTAVSKVDEIVELMLDCYHSTDRCPMVEKLERIVRSVELKMAQLRRAVETGEEEEAWNIMRRVLKKVSRFYRAL
jgi:hypothetical protein